MAFDFAEHRWKLTKAMMELARRQITPREAHKVAQDAAKELKTTDRVQAAFDRSKAKSRG